MICRGIIFIMNLKRVLVRGGGDLASGVVACLYRYGWQVVVAELAQPLVVRRKVAFASAIYDETIKVEEIVAKHVKQHKYLDNHDFKKSIPVIVDPDLNILKDIPFFAVVDARMLKSRFYDDNPRQYPLIGLGPSFEAGLNCDVVIETNRGANLGKVIWKGKPEAATGEPAKVNGISYDRVLYAPVAGVVKQWVAISKSVDKDQLVATVGDVGVYSKIKGVVRGLIQDGIHIQKGTKIADIDPRNEIERCHKISDKAIIIGLSTLKALEAIYWNNME